MSSCSGRDQQLLLANKQTHESKIVTTLFVTATATATVYVARTAIAIVVDAVIVSATAFRLLLLLLLLLLLYLPLLLLLLLLPIYFCYFFNINFFFPLVYFCLYPGLLLHPQYKTVSQKGPLSAGGSSSPLTAHLPPCQAPSDHPHPRPSTLP